MGACSRAAAPAGAYILERLGRPGHTTQLFLFITASVTYYYESVSVTCYSLPVTSYVLRTVTCYLLLGTYYVLLLTQYLLLITCCLLVITYCLLLTNCCVPPGTPKTSTCTHHVATDEPVPGTTGHHVATGRQRCRGLAGPRGDSGRGGGGACPLWGTATRRR